MTPSPEFSHYIEDLFADFGSVSVRPMFGGAGIFHVGIMFGLVSDGTIYLRASADSAANYVAEGSGKFRYRARGRTIEMPYWRLPERLVDDTSELAVWAGQAFDDAVAAKQGKGAVPGL